MQVALARHLDQILMHLHLIESQHDILENIYVNPDLPQCL